MSILKIARMGHPVLQSSALPVKDPSALEIVGLVADMIDTLEDAEGVGLAAPQVHVPLRLVIFHVPQDEMTAGRYQNAGLDDEEAGVPLTVLINPKVEPLGEDTVEGMESCLSLPGMSGVVERYLRIRYSGLDLEGKAIEREAEGFHARVVQHECDHLDGILYPMRISDMIDFGYTEELKRAISAANSEQE